MSFLMSLRRTLYVTPYPHYERRQLGCLWGQHEGRQKGTGGPQGWGIKNAK